MDNKKTGIIIISISLLLIIILLLVRNSVNRAYQQQIDFYEQTQTSCPSDPNICPHEQRARAQTPFYIGLTLVLGLITLGIYMLFFERSQKEIIKTLEKQKQIQNREEKIEILMKGLDEDEKKIIKALSEHDGIPQYTLGLRTNIHKSKLSLILRSLEKKSLISKVRKGKVNKIFLKIAL
jgi:uncharacterized membrane protein